MENISKVSFIAFVKNIRNHWSVEEVSYFLANKLPHMDFGVDTLDCQKRTVLELLVGNKTRHNSRDKLVMCLLLKHGANPLKKCRGGRTIMQAILRNTDSTLIIKFLKYVKNVNMLHGGSTVLHIATRRELKDVVEYVIGRKADINKMSDSQTTPLHEAARTGRVDITQILLENGADIEARDRTRQTPLHWALGFSHSFELVRVLLSNGADVNSRDELGRTPLHTLCCKGLHINLDIYELLLQKVADVNATDVKGSTPLHNLMKFLPVDSISDNKKLIELVVHYGGSLTKQDQVYGTVLHAAAFFNHSVPFLKFLIEKGADTSSLNTSNETFMNCMLRSSRSRVEQLLKCLLVDEYQNKFKFNEVILDFIRSDEGLTEFEHMCRTELRILGEEKLKMDDSLSLFRVMTVCEKILAKFFRNYPSRIEIKDLKIGRFLIYGMDLERNYENGLARYEAEISIFDHMTKISDNVLNRDCIEEIVKAISTENINSFKGIYTSVGFPSRKQKTEYP